MADLGLANQPRAEHAAFVSSWLKILKHDRRAIFTIWSRRNGD
jgi:antirestriction protein ArdC